ncbi:hypothetical protein ACWD1Z_34545 [Streptomyces sp. NPDC002784]
MLELPVVHGVKFGQGDPQRGQPSGVESVPTHARHDPAGPKSGRQQSDGHYERPRVLERCGGRSGHPDGQHHDGQGHDQRREDLRGAAWAAHLPPRARRQRLAGVEAAGCGAAGGVVEAASPNPNTCPHNQSPASSPAIIQPLIRFALRGFGLRRMCPRT